MSFGDAVMKGDDDGGVGDGDGDVVDCPRRPLSTRCWDLMSWKREMEWRSKLR